MAMSSLLSTRHPRITRGCLIGSVSNMKSVAVKGFAYDVVLFQCPGIQATDEDKWRDKETWRKLYQVGRQ